MRELRGFWYLRRFYLLKRQKTPPPCPFSEKSLSQTRKPEGSLGHKLWAAGEHHHHLQGAGVGNPHLRCPHLGAYRLPGQSEEATSYPKHCPLLGSLVAATKGPRQHTCTRRPGYFQLKTAWVSCSDNTWLVPSALPIHPTQ